MTLHLEVEEGFGRAWHRFITRRASPEFDEAAVPLDAMRRNLLLLFRGTGGEAGVGVEAASPRELLVRRSLLQQVAGTCQQLPVAWFDADSLRLPAQLAVYPDAELNRELYRWLALLAAHSQPMRHWARDNQAWTLAVLERYPLLRPRYQRLVEAQLSLRPDPAALPPPKRRWSVRCNRPCTSRAASSACPAARRPPGRCRCGSTHRNAWPRHSTPNWWRATSRAAPPTARPRARHANGPSAPGRTPVAAACCCSVWRTCSAGPSTSNWTVPVTTAKTSMRPRSRTIWTTSACRGSGRRRAAG